MQATLKIDGYDSFEQIALGGMAAVYKARKKSIKKPVAIKVLFPHLAADERFARRLKDEAEAAARIQHDNIVNVIDFGESDGSYYIVMEYYDGQTVERLLEEHPRLPIDIAFAIILNVCYGLEAAHKEKLVHRDIKPANIILTQQGGVKIADFGLARSTEKLKRTTLDGRVIGTPAYMSPEQASGGRVDVPSDIFSLGVVAFELACGFRPFEGRGYMEVVDAIQHKNADRISAHNPLVDGALDDIVFRMLARDVEDRYQDVSRLVADLEGALNDRGFRYDARALADFHADPDGYRDALQDRLLEDLSGTPPAGGSVNREEQIRYYRKINYLDPSDEGARKQLVQLGEEPIERRKGERRAVDRGGEDRRRPVRPPSDHDADYAVYLDSIDESVETRDSFALKLSMRIKTPLPRIRTLVNQAPCQLFAKVSYDKAKKLTRVIERLGGTARMEAVTPKPPTPKTEDSPKENVAVSREPGDPQRAPTEEHVAMRRSIGWRGVTCPACGSAEEPDARFCSFCAYNLQTRPPLTPEVLLEHRRRAAENPLSAQGGGSFLGRLAELPRHVQILGGLGILTLILLIIFGR